MKPHIFSKIAVVALMASPLGIARGDLILSSPAAVEIGGTGLGTVVTVLTIQDNGTENGAVCRSGSADVFGGTVNAGGTCVGSDEDVKTGASQTLTRALSEAAVTSASNFAIVFNANQPAGGAITLTGLTATFYTASGGFLFQASTTQSYEFPDTFQGTGNSGFLFVLTPGQQALATAAGAFNSGTNRVGLAASLSNTAGGNETFFLANNGVPPTVVPEPSSAVLLATGFLGLAGFLRRRARREAEV